ncbi:MAG: ABC-2 family transporter protein [Spirochaetales bacterium]|nr:ABC-2 family transporter protein [Spirochaetales bacterium]
MLRMKIRKYIKVFGIRVQDRLAYKGSFFGEIFFYGLITFMITRLWTVVYANKPDFLGLTRSQLIWYVVFTEFIAISSAKVFHTFAREIKEGSISYLLLRPYHYILYRFADMSGVLFIKMLFNGCVACVLSLTITGPLIGFNPVVIPRLILTFIAAFILDFFIQTCLGMTAFWMEENTAIYWIYSKLGLILGILLPQDIYPAGVQAVMRFLPWRYIYYGPARLAVGFDAKLFQEIITGQAGFLLLFIPFTFYLFNVGKRKVVHNGG